MREELFQVIQGSDLELFWSSLDDFPVEMHYFVSTSQLLIPSESSENASRGEKDRSVRQLLAVLRDALQILFGGVALADCSGRKIHHFVPEKFLAIR